MDVEPENQNCKSNDFLQISGLKRGDWQNFWHPNMDFLKTLESSGIQVYLLEGTIYGCFVNISAGSKVDVKWFGHHLSRAKNNIGKVVPNSTLDLYQVLELCEPSKVEGLIFNLDILG